MLAAEGLGQSHYLLVECRPSPTLVGWNPLATYRIYLGAFQLGSAVLVQNRRPPLVGRIPTSYYLCRRARPPTFMMVQQHSPSSRA
jgi:hypothetical protein